MYLVIQLNYPPLTFRAPLNPNVAAAADNPARKRNGARFDHRRPSVRLRLHRARGGQGKTLAFDREVMLALRGSADPRVPIGPTWLPEVARDLTSLGSVVRAGHVTVGVVGYLFLAGRSAVAWLTLVLFAVF